MSNDQPYIILAEEDAVLAQVTAFRLELLGFRVVCVHSATDLFEVLAAELPDTIILDMYLPDLDGFDVASRLTCDQRTSQVPIVAFSTSGDPKDVKRAFAAGTRDFVVTPYDPAVLQDKLHRLTQRST